MGRRATILDCDASVEPFAHASHSWKVRRFRYEKKGFAKICCHSTLVIGAWSIAITMCWPGHQYAETIPTEETHIQQTRDAHLCVCNMIDRNTCPHARRIMILTCTKLLDRANCGMCFEPSLAGQEAAPAVSPLFPDLYTEAPETPFCRLFLLDRIGSCIGAETAIDSLIRGIEKHAFDVTIFRLSVHEPSFPACRHSSGIDPRRRPPSLELDRRAHLSSIRRYV